MKIYKKEEIVKTRDYYGNRAAISTTFVNTSPEVEEIIKSLAEEIAGDIKVVENVIDLYHRVEIDVCPGSSSTYTHVFLITREGVGIDPEDLIGFVEM